MAIFAALCCCVEIRSDQLLTHQAVEREVGAKKLKTWSIGDKESSPFASLKEDERCRLECTGCVVGRL